MRVLRDRQDCVCALQSDPPTSQHSPVVRAEQFWSEWEIQIFVLVSFSLQVFLLFSAGFRKRYSFRVLSVLIWLAYLLADSVAVFVLGRLTLLVGHDPRHQLVLFWAPFLLLHLGGQETITAFSIEDCTLWKRHLLNLTTQMALAIYVVGKQWRGDKQLVVPMVLMFISGTMKYVERIWALRRAGSWAPGSRSSNASGLFIWERVAGYYPELVSIISDKQDTILEHVMGAAKPGFWLIMNLFMDTAPSFQVRNSRVANMVEGSGDRANHLVYKLVEIQLSLIYDYLYTKFGSLIGVFHRLITLVLTSTALALFVVSRVDQTGRLLNYSRADVTISYILLVGAIVLEISSIFMWFMSSYWPYMPISCPRIVRRIGVSGRSCFWWRVIPRSLKCLCIRNRVEWSGNIKQYNMIGGCIQEIQAGRLERMMHCMGIKRDYTTHIVVSPEVKKLLLVKLIEVRRNSNCELSLTSFHGQWAQQWALEANRQDHHSATDQPSSHSESAAQRALRVSDIQSTDFVSSVCVWHIVTDICLVAHGTNGGSKFRSFSRDLSNYMMYLVAKCNVMVTADGYLTLETTRRDCLDRVSRYSADPRREYIQEVCNDDTYHVNFVPIEELRLVSSELLKSEAAADRWELIATVWVEMLCYIARNCGPGFHAKHLSTGGEFVTHVKMLLHVLRFPF